MTRPSIKAIGSVLLIITFVIIIDFIIGYLGNILFKNIPDNQTEYSRMNYSISKTEADCIVLGSSHASHHYNPDILQDSLNMTVYNAGRGGHGITYSLALFKAILSRHIPKMVILDIKYQETDEWISRVRDLRPYFKDYKYALETDVEVNGGSERIRMMWNSYRYNSTLLGLLNSYFTGAEAIRCNGYDPIPVRKSKQPSIKIQEEPTRAVNPMYKECLTELASLCNDHNILLITVSSPTLVRLKYESPAVSIIDSLGISYLDHFNDEYFLDHIELFRDGDHLYETGANIFSMTIGSEIKDIINKEIKE